MPAARSSKKPNPGCGMVVGGKFKHVNIAGTNPLREQFAPTEGQPIRQRARMAGDPMGEANSANSAAMDAGSVSRKSRERPLGDESDKTLQSALREKAGNKAFQSDVKAEIVKRIADPVR